jgi:hypothetical protein
LGARVTPKFSVNPGGWGLAALAVCLTTCPALAGARVENRCHRLSGAEYEELDARVQLLLKSEGESRSAPAVVCSEQGAWVEWEGQRFAIVGRAPLVDEVVDIVEAQLHDAQRATEADPKTTEDRAVADGQPMLQAGAGTPPPLPAVGHPADARAVRAADARGGGVTVSFETEVPTDTFPFAIGPAFDFGASLGPLMIGGREAFRSTTGKQQVVFMDFDASIGYGAPLNPDALLGAVMRFGAEWMVVYPQGNSGQAAVVPEMAVGGRIAHSFGAIGLWFGADARFRLSRLALHAREVHQADDVTLCFSLGAAFVDWSRK